MNRKDFLRYCNGFSNKSIDLNQLFAQKLNEEQNTASDPRTLAAERLKKAREAENAANANNKPSNFDWEAENAKSTATSTSQPETGIPIDPKTGKRLDMWDPKDADHNLKVSDWTYNQALKRAEAGDAGVDLRGIRDTHLARQEDIIKDIKWRNQVKAVEKGIDTFADVVGMIPVAGDVVDAAHALSYKLRGTLSDDPEEAARYNKAAVDTAIYGLLLPAGVGAAAKGIAKGTAVATKATAKTAGELVGKGAQAAAAAEKLTTATGNVLKKVSTINPIGAAGGGYAAYSAVDAANPNASLGTKLAAGFAGSLAGGLAVKQLNKVPGLGKVINDPSGSLPFYAGKATGKIARGSADVAQAALEKIPAPRMPEIPAAVSDAIKTAKNKAAVVAVTGSLLTNPMMPKGEASMGPIRSDVASQVEAPARANTEAAPKVEIETPTKAEAGQRAKAEAEAKAKAEAEAKAKEVEKAKAPAKTKEVQKALANTEAGQRAKAEAEARAEAEGNAKPPKTDENAKPPKTKQRTRGGPLKSDGGRNPNTGNSNALGVDQYGFSRTNFAGPVGPVFTPTGARNQSNPSAEPSLYSYRKVYDKDVNESNDLKNKVKDLIREKLIK